MLWQSEEEEKKNRERLRLRHPPGLPPPSWKHRVRALALHVLIMINAGTTTHTETAVLAGFWPGSLLGPAVLHAAVNTLVWIVKVPVHKAVKFQEDSSAQRFSQDGSKENHPRAVLKSHQNLAVAPLLVQNYVHTLMCN